MKLACWNLYMFSLPFDFTSFALDYLFRFSVTTAQRTKTHVTIETTNCDIHRSATPMDWFQDRANTTLKAKLSKRSLQVQVQVQVHQSTTQNNTAKLRGISKVRSEDGIYSQHQGTRSTLIGWPIYCKHFLCLQ